MPNKKTTGVDKISITMIKNNLNTFVPILYYIFNLSIESGVYPRLFKVASITPIFKSGQLNDLNNYRPIAVLSVISKIFDKCIHTQVLHYFLSNEYFSTKQYGFLPGKGCDLAVFEHVNKIVENIEDLKYCAGIYIDFKKAFDLVDLNILLHKLASYGIKNNELKLFQTFLFNRQQFVKLNDTCSDPRVINCGVPQGGVLGPFLFLVYINDLLELDYHSSIFAYADDTSLICSANNQTVLKYKLQSDLDKLSSWLIENRIIINTNKTKVVVYSYRPGVNSNVKEDLILRCHTYRCLYQCVCNTIEIVPNIRYLGCIIDEKLKWDSHCKNLLTKLRKISYNIYHLRNYLDINALKKLYYSWFQSVLSYGIIHWGGTFLTHVDPIVHIQIMVIRTIFGIRKYDSVSQLFVEHKIMTVMQLYLYKLINFLKSYITIFTIKSCARNLRSTLIAALQPLKYSKETSRRQAYYMITDIYNKNLNCINLLSSVSAFKRNLKDLLFSNSIKH